MLKSILRRPIAAVLASVATTTLFLVINFLFTHASGIGLG